MQTPRPHGRTTKHPRTGTTLDLLPIVRYNGRMTRSDLVQAMYDSSDQLGDYRVLPLHTCRELEARFGLLRSQLELAALETGVVPRRYLRNMGTLGLEGQLSLLRATVALVGLGGLGGYVLEGLARAGVGHVIAIDGDVFEDHNLNRQMLSTEAALGTPKAAAAVSRVASINCAVRITPHASAVSADNAASLLEGAQVVIDALDNIPSRLILQEAAAALGVPMVHGSIAGFVGQVMTIMPGDPGLHALYGAGELPAQGVEQTLGTPAATPMLVAAFEVQEAIKLITGIGQPLRNVLLFIDTESCLVERIELGAPGC